MTPAGELLSDERLRALRLRAQRLAGRRRRAEPGVLARDLLCVQAQISSAAALALRARGAGFGAAAVEHARLEQRSIVKTWCMRGTLHLIPAEDAGWLLPLFGSALLRKGQKRLRDLGIASGEPERAAVEIGRMLAGGEALTRAEIGERLARAGFATEGQATVHLIMRAALRGVVCLGPDRGREPSYVALGRWLPDSGGALPEREALAELTRRYLRAYGPAAPQDLAGWSGLGTGAARSGFEAIARELVEVGTSAGPMWSLGPRPRAAGKPVLRLLPSFDTYLLGYRDRSLVVAPEHARRVLPGGGMLRPVVTVGGRAVATWRLDRTARRVRVTVEPFEEIPDEAGPSLREEAADVGRFLGLPAELG